MGMRGSDSATLARERERLESIWAPEQSEAQAEWPQWLDELLEAPAATSDEQYTAHARGPELPAPDRPEWLDFSAYHEVAPRRAPAGHRYETHAPAEPAVRPPRDSRGLRFARIARDIRRSWGPETTAYATGFHPAAAPAPTAERPRQAGAPRPTPGARAALAPTPPPRPTPRPPARPSVRLRVAQVSRRLAELASHHVVIRIPGRAPRKAPKAEVEVAVAAAVGNHMPVAKLPRIWLLANLMILLVAGWAIVPRLAIVTPESACAWHVVAPGDTLGKLGAAHHTSALAIAHANSLAVPDQIYVGERLCIPLAFFASSGAAPYVPAPPQPPRYGPVSGVHNFIAFVLPYARRAHDATGWPTSLIIAQWGLEHGWRLPGYTGYNFGNCGAVPGEATIGGLNVPGSPSAFTYSKTPEDGLRVYIHVAHLSFYAGVAWAAQHQGVDAAARSLGQSPWDAGHYTDHNDPGSSLIAILHAYNLYQYD